MKLVERKGYPGTFDWIKGKGSKAKLVATITLYEEGLVEFSDVNGNKDVVIECVGTKNPEVNIHRRTMETDSFSLEIDRASITVS